MVFFHILHYDNYIEMGGNMNMAGSLGQGCPSADAGPGAR